MEAEVEDVHKELRLGLNRLFSASRCLTGRPSAKCHLREHVATAA